MLIMGIDPGIAISGYGLINSNNNTYSVLEYGVLRTANELPVEQRLKRVFDGYIALIEKYKPEAVAIEELFFNKNAKTIITVGEARGIALLAAAIKGIEVFEYTPLQVKQAIVGYGRAQKIQIQQMVKILLNLDKLPKPDDAADALAVALCHLNTNRSKELFYEGGL